MSRKTTEAPSSSGLGQKPIQGRLGKPNTIQTRLGRPEGIQSRLGKPEGIQSRLGQCEGIQNRLGRPKHEVRCENAEEEIVSETKKFDLLSICERLDKSRGLKKDHTDSKGSRDSNDYKGSRDSNLKDSKDYKGLNHQKGFKDQRNLNQKGYKGSRDSKVSSQSVGLSERMESQTGFGFSQNSSRKNVEHKATSAQVKKLTIFELFLKSTTFLKFIFNL